MATLQEVAAAKDAALAELVEHGLTVKSNADGFVTVYVVGLDERPAGNALGRFRSTAAAVQYYARAGWPSVELHRPPAPTKKEETIPVTTLPKLQRGEAAQAVAEFSKIHDGEIDLNKLTAWMMEQYDTNPSAVRQNLAHLVNKGFAAWTSSSAAVEVKGLIQKYSQAIERHGPNKALSAMGLTDERAKKEPVPKSAYPTLDDLDQVGFAKDGRPIARDQDGGVWTVVLERV